VRSPGWLGAELARILVQGLDELARRLTERGHVLAGEFPDLALLDAREADYPDLVERVRAAGCPVVCLVRPDQEQRARALVERAAVRLIFHVPGAWEVERWMTCAPVDPGVTETRVRSIFRRHQANLLASLERIRAPESPGEAVQLAHRLTGNLGSFGLPRGTELARVLERDLAASLPGRVEDLLQELHREIAWPQWEPNLEVTPVAPMGRRLLVLDDDLAALDAAAALLGPVATLDDPLELWDALERVRPELLLLDLELPHVHGLDLLRALREDRRHRTLPVLALTHRRDTAGLAEIFEAGADDYARKPFLAPELRARVRALTR